MWAGIGDALSKQVESEFSSRNDELDHQDALGVQIAQMVNDRLIRYGKHAMEASHANKANYALEQVLQDIIVSTGLTSVLVKNDYNSAAAHSFYYGSTVLPKMEHHLHGAIVSYGVLTLLTMDQQYEERDRIFDFMRSIDLPVHFAQFDLNTEDDLDKILDKYMTTGDIVHVPYPITREMAHQAILDTEAYVAKRLAEQ